MNKFLLAWLLLLTVAASGFGQHRSQATLHRTLQLTTPLAAKSVADQTQVGKQFLKQYGTKLGAAKSSRAQLQSTNLSPNGHRYLRFQQMIDGRPVLGGNFTLVVNPAGMAHQFSGVLLPQPTWHPAPRRPKSTVELEVAAKRAMTDWYPHAEQWQLTEGAPVYVRRNPWVASANDPLRPARVFDLTEPAGHRAARIYLDEESGLTIFRHQLHCDLDRELYERSTSTFNRIWSEGDAFPGSLEAEGEEALRATGEIYNLMHRTFGRDGYDGQGGTMQVVVNARIGGCPNANARGNQTRFCAGVVSDDVVAHEWTHSYLTATNGLIYAYQSGAINEGYADIFGEVVDLLNNRGTDTNDDQLRTGCFEDNMRWRIAEDITAIDSTLRDLWQPNCREDAEFVTDPLYVCPGEFSRPERGDVHSNSGPVRRTFTLLTDGGILNGDTIRALGMTKALHLFYHINANYLTPATDYHAFADMLDLAGRDLLDVNLPALTLLDLPAMASGDSIKADDLVQIAKAARATQLRLADGCPLVDPVLSPAAPKPCAEAPVEIFAPVLHERWNDSLSQWTVDAAPLVDSTWTDNRWRVTDLLPDGRMGTGLFAANPNLGNCNNIVQSGTVSLTSPVIDLPTSESIFRLTFDHYLATEDRMDGGRVEYSLNGSAFTAIPITAFIFNGYNALLKQSFSNDNPLAGQRAFSGFDGNSTSGSWGTSIVDLNVLGAVGGDDLQLRWVFGQNGCDGRLGWYLDDVRIGYCGEPIFPVQWLNFSATPAKDHIALRWATAAERDNAGFGVERRTLTGTFAEIGWVAAGDNYQFDDREALPDITYVYRLRQTDTDGTVSYSPLVQARLAADSALTIYPNPVRQQLFVRGADGGSAILLDVSGRQVAATDLVDGRGVINTGSLAGGCYYLRAGKTVRRVVIVR